MLVLVELLLASALRSYVTPRRSYLLYVRIRAREYCLSIATRVQVVEIVRGTAGVVGHCCGPADTCA